MFWNDVQIGIGSTLRHAGPRLCAAHLRALLVNARSQVAHESRSSGPVKSSPKGPVFHPLMIRYNRAELYEKVWSKPLLHVAKEYRISDTGLGKVCRIPVPGLGYWNPVASKHVVRLNGNWSHHESRMDSRLAGHRRVSESEAEAGRDLDGAPERRTPLRNPLRCAGQRGLLEGPYRSDRHSDCWTQPSMQAYKYLWIPSYSIPLASPDRWRWLGSVASSSRTQVGGRRDCRAPRRVLKLDWHDFAETTKHFSCDFSVCGRPVWARQLVTYIRH